MTTILIGLVGFVLFSLPMIISFQGARLHWKVLCNICGIGSLFALFYYQSGTAAGFLWIAAVVLSALSLRYTHADARTDRIIEALRPQPIAPSIAGAEPPPSDKTTRIVSNLSLFFGLFAGVALIAVLLTR